MTNITFKGNPLKTVGTLPKAGANAPDCTLTKTDLTDLTLHSLQGKKVVLNIFPSLDTPTCASSVRKFNEAAGKLSNTTVLCISADLPFAHKRFCTTENLQNVVTASTFRHPEFGKQYGVAIIEGPMTGLMSRAVVVIDEHGKVIYTQQVAEITSEPDYDAALAAVKK